MGLMLKWLRHRWMDASDSQAWVPDAMAGRLTAAITLGEQGHSGQVRLVIEAGLPSSYLWRAWRGLGMPAVVRQRALGWFGRLRVWDTEHNNGLLIYVLLAEHAIELVADRGLAQRLPADHWKPCVHALGKAFAAGQVEAGLHSAIEEAHLALVQHFARPPHHSDEHPNELPDAVLRC